MSDPQHENDIDIMARHLVNLGFELVEGDTPWEHLPDICEGDFDRIIIAAKRLLPDVAPGAEFDAAYERLELRAQAADFWREGEPE